MRTDTLDLTRAFLAGWGVATSAAGITWVLLFCHFRQVVKAAHEEAAQACAEARRLSRLLNDARAELRSVRQTESVQ